ncbi:hypothetical protein H1P_1890015 [Hyella patelloides LEGE 07179]|uniref:Uncharacterized protein n=1 Tax=Hyella patelloides LEGE 07179 TaxID=945734 RepID=A0A563VP52_9CYAN|nr:hypothetical protein H1P_1890015 [Hyella patelloides LEGE 07179]
MRIDLIINNYQLKHQPRYQRSACQQTIRQSSSQHQGIN